MTIWRWGRRNNTGAETSRTATRLLILALMGFLWSALVVARLVQLQVLDYRAYKTAAEQQQQRSLVVEAPRGSILDRSGRPLALSVQVDSVCVNPLRIPNRPVAAEILARVLNVDRDDLLEKMDRAVAERQRLGKQARGAGFLWVKRKITPEESAALRSMNLEWIEFRRESQRYYPDGWVGSHIVGTVDFQEHGNLGLEQALDRTLHGKAGSVRMITDVRQRGVEAISSRDAEPGETITLSIDQRIQYIAEREIKAACELHHATSGSVVVANPYTGEILALASYPDFDPNAPPKAGDDPKSRFDHPVSVPFEPGSVFKIITLSAALETTDLRPESMINCGNGTIRLFGRVVHEAKHGYGMLSMADVLAKSSNVGAIQIGLRVGPERLLEYVQRFGFGRRTGVPLPAESSGMVRDLKHWGKTSIGSVAMGHEISTTTLQLAQACSVIANGGVLVRPRLVLSRQKPGQKPANVASDAPRRILKPETAITMRQMMEGVVLHGTGKAARLAGYTSGGKTGSAQIFDFATKHYTHSYNGSFVGFAPVTNPAVVIAVSLNGTHGTGGFGGVVAAPVFKAVATEALRLMDVPKDLPETLPEPTPRPEEFNDLAIADMANPPDDLTPDPPPLDPGTPEQAVTLLARSNLGPRVPSFQGKTVRAVLEESLALGVTVDVIGTGVARAQIPAPGSSLNAGERVRVEFR